MTCSAESPSRHSASESLPRRSSPGPVQNAGENHCRTKSSIDSALPAFESSPAVFTTTRAADRAAIGFGADQLYLQPRIVAGNVIAQQRRRLVQIDHQNVEIAVIIEISESAAPAVVRFQDRGSGLIRELLESSLAQVAKQHSGISSQETRDAFSRFPEKCVLPP